jgi:flagellar motility protein MotE (MotC chaperone)
MATKKKNKRAPRKRRIVRLLPLTITMLSLLFIIKMNEVYLGSRQLREIYGARDAVAEEKKTEHGSDEAKKDEVKKEEPKKEGDAKEGDAKKEGEAATKEEVKKEEGGHGEAKKEEGGHGGGEKEAKPPEEEKTYGTGKSTVKEIEAIKARDAQPRYTQTELDLLQNLSKRRDELDQRERDLDIKAKVLEASEKRITDKIAEIKTLEAELSKVLAQYNEKQDGQIKSLVKIYESMKPEEAAAIFNELEMPILLDVIGKMSERKVALVLANMSPKRARDVTQELADRRKKAAQNAAAAAASAPSPTPAPAALPVSPPPAAAPATPAPAVPTATPPAPAAPAAKVEEPAKAASEKPKQ